jgi:hypothetical protein
MRKQQKDFIRMLIYIHLVFFAGVLYVLAGEYTVKFAWDEHSQKCSNGDDCPVDHFELHEAAQAGGPYDQSTVVVDDIKPGTETQVDYTSTKPDGVVTKRFFVLKAIKANGGESDPSNEMALDYDFAPIDAPFELAAAVDGNNVDFTWQQADVDRVDHWKLFVDYGDGEFVELAQIDYTGQPGPQFSKTETLTVADGEKKVYQFVMVAFTKFGINSADSNVVAVTIDKTKPAAVLNFRIRITSE